MRVSEIVFVVLRGLWSCLCRQSLWFGRGEPKQWLEDGKTIWIEKAAIAFGTAEMVI